MKKIFSCLALTVLFFACKKTEIPVQPVQESIPESTVEKKAGATSLTVTTTSVYVGSATGASANGNVSNSGGGNVSERGFCYSTSAGPTINDDTARAGSGTGNFQRGFSGLSIATTYYVKAYAIKNGTVYYGNQLSFTTLSLGMPSPGVGTVYDIDGNAYNTITLGTKVWMVENLKTTRYTNGDLISNVPDNTEWTNATSGAYCDYDNNPANSAEYGRLYNLFAIKDVRNLAPAGWHVPNLSEWQTTMYFLGGGGFAGGRMKEAGLAHWDSPNIGADNSSWFTALGSGSRYYGSITPQFRNLKRRTTWWSSSSSFCGPSCLPSINSFSIEYNSASYTIQLGSIQGGAAYGYAVRCVKDN